MMLNTQILAGQPLEIYEPLDFLRLMFAENPLDITYYRDHAEAFEADQVKGGYAEEFREPVHKVVIRSATTQFIQVVGRLGARVSYDTPPEGLVQVTNTPSVIVQSQTDAGRAIVMSEQSYSGYVATGFSSGFYSYIQMFNPPTSGKRALVRKVRAFHTHTSPAGMVLRVGTVAGIGTVQTNKPQNRVLGAAESVQELRAAYDGSGLYGSGMTTVYGGSYEKVMLMDARDRPLVIPPGRGLVISCGTASVPIAATFEFDEETI